MSKWVEVTKIPLGIQRTKSPFLEDRESFMKELNLNYNLKDSNQVFG